MTPRIRQVPIAELVEDMEIYPRHGVDRHHVRALADAIVAGEELPPIVADANTKVVVDGWHRLRAYRRILGDDAKVPVELISYPDRAAMIRDAVSRNVRHGLRLQVIDQVRAIRLLEQAGFDRPAIAAILNRPVTKIERLTIRVGYSDRSRDVVPLKRPVIHLAGQVLTEKQEQVHRMLGGTDWPLHIRQLREALDADLVPREPQIMAELEALAAAIDRFRRT